MDEHWTEVMKMAEKYGFIVQTYGGIALLATHENQLKYFGEGQAKEVKEIWKQPKRTKLLQET